MDEVGGACSAHGENENWFNILVEKPEGRPRRRWEDNIEVDLRELRK
jgi:hypothetical protein